MNMYIHPEHIYTGNWKMSTTSIPHTSNCGSAKKIQTSQFKHTQTTEIRNEAALWVVRRGKETFFQSKVDHLDALARRHTGC